jgi:hypothetical protein
MPGFLRAFKLHYPVTFQKGPFHLGKRRQRSCYLFLSLAIAKYSGFGVATTKIRPQLEFP